jgi:hypothetical protein
LPGTPPYPACRDRAGRGPAGEAGRAWAASAGGIIDPAGGGPRIWFQVVPEPKTAKNRLHLDVHVSGGRAVPLATRRQRVDAEARRLAGLGATVTGSLTEEGFEHYGVAMKDPEGNEFDIN